MFFFLKKTVYLGNSLEELGRIRAALAAAGIGYEIRTISPDRPQSSRSQIILTSRDSRYDLYALRVKASDEEAALQLIHA